MKLASQLITLTLATLLVLFVMSALSDYITQILGIIILFAIIYITVMKRKKKDDQLFTGSHVEVFALVTGILLTIILTGGSGSALFFLVYFLLFGLAFMYSPITVFYLLLGIVVVFAPYLTQDDLMDSLVRFGSLLLLSPIAYFFGSEFVRREQLEAKIEEKTMEILEDSEAVLATHENGTTDEEVEAIDDIMEAATELRDETKS